MNKNIGINRDNIVGTIQIEVHQSNKSVLSTLFKFAWILFLVVNSGC